MRFLCLSLSFFFAVFASLRATPAGAATDSIRIEHDIAFQRTPGLPAKIHVSAVGVEIQWVRLVGTVDDALLVIPLRPSGPRAFEGEIPTPEKLLRYSFQFGVKGGDTRLSPVFFRRQNCTGLEPDKPADKRRQLIEDAKQLDLDSEQLLYLQRMIDGFSERSRQDARRGE